MSGDTLFIGSLLCIIIVMLSAIGTHIFQNYSEIDEKMKARLIGSFSFMPSLALGIFGIYLGISYLMNLSDIANSSRVVWYWLTVSFLALGSLIGGYAVITTLFIFSFKMLKDTPSLKDMQIKSVKNLLIAVAGLVIIILGMIVSVGAMV
ncbi:MAG: hypothetical protein ACTSYD_09085 [Candidatus Heimdallarchaeaceae archaeon]